MRTKSKLENTASNTKDVVKTKRWPCNICKKFLATRTLLRQHKIKQHAIKRKPQEKIKLIKKTNLKATKTQHLKKLVSARVSRRLQLKKEKKDEMKEIITPKKEVLSKDEEKSTINTEFECPVCQKVFPVFFSASKHIQKKHTDAQDEKKEPIRVDKCTLCSERIEDEYHVCSQDDESGLSYKCLGCLRKFASLQEFSEHVSVRHVDDADVMTFRTVHDFRTWKVNTEAQINSRYSVFEKSSKGQYHHCNFVCPKNQKNITFLCPSVMITKEISKKLHVQYFKNHYGHETPPYELRDEYKKNLVDEEDFQTLKNTQKAYQKFKSLMESIITDASSTNLDNLRKLLTMAVKMQEYLELDEEEPSHLSKNMTDYQISEELEDKSSLRMKRTAVTLNNKGGKKIKTEMDDAFDSLLSPRSKSPPSFNDSYKQFIDSSTSTTLKPAVTKKGKKDVIKTKIQFIPNPRKVIVKPSPEKTKPNILRPSKGNTSNISESGIINDIQYEVREQENDCNILVLKI